MALQAKDQGVNCVSWLTEQKTMTTYLESAIW